MKNFFTIKNAGLDRNGNKIYHISGYKQANYNEFFPMTKAELEPIGGTYTKSGYISTKCYKEQIIEKITKHYEDYAYVIC